MRFGRCVSFLCDDYTTLKRDGLKAMKSSMPDAAGPDSDESDSLPEDLDGDSDDASVPIEQNSNHGNDSDEGSWGSGFEEDDDDLVGSEVDAPDGLLPLGYDEAQEEEDEWGGIGADAAVTGRKRKAKDQPNSDRRKKRRLRDLPTFASAEEYARLIDGADEENL